ncbi:MAG: cupredoxin domain-containing protein [Dehalococcoidia bacterium]
MAAVFGLLEAFRNWRAPAVTVRDGYQEVHVNIKGRYRPDSVEVRTGMPVRMWFNRAEDEECSERVIIAGMGIDRYLPAFRETVVEFLPREPGTFLFTCQAGMYRGRLVVRPRRVA